MLKERKRIEERIRDYERKIIELKRNLNELAPVALLPPELLADIFLLASLKYSPDKKSKGPYLWVWVTHVSFHWRQVALGTPSLWSKIILTPTRYLTPRADVVGAMLMRSAGTSLAVGIDMRRFPEELTNIRGRVLDDLERIHKLSLRVKSRLDLKQLEDSRCRRAPRLRSLAISVTDHNSWNADEAPLPWISSLVPLKLQELDINGFPLAACQILVTPALTSLTLAGFSTYMTIPRILAVLRGLPCLQRLALCDNLDRSEEDTSHEDRTQKTRTELSCLRQLHLHSTLALCAEFLPMLSLSRTIAMNLVIYHWRTYPNLSASQTMMHTIMSVVDQSTVTDRLQCLSISDGRHLPGSMLFRAWSSLALDMRETLATMPKIGLKILDFKVSDIGDIDMLRSDWPLARVQGLHLDISWSTDALYKRTFAHMQDVAHLYLSPTLNPRTGGYFGANFLNRNGSLFPRLQTLLVDDLSGPDGDRLINDLIFTPSEKRKISRVYVVKNMKDTYISANAARLEDHIEVLALPDSSVQVGSGSPDAFGFSETDFWINGNYD